MNSTLEKPRTRGPIALRARPWPASIGFAVSLALVAAAILEASSSVTENTAAAPSSRGKEMSTPKENHWAFKSPSRPSVLVPGPSGWAKNPIDQFILEKLKREGLRPSPEADRIVLLRRLSLDLTGLPPTPEEADAFLSDRSEGAYERQAERLLNSPHFGERWARDWLDAARYADSNGYEKDRAREMWHYRDWVVEAINQDLPYDQFIIKQFAGDLLPGSTQRDLIATGFLRNSMINEEGAIDPEQFRMDAMFDRMEAVGKGVLGLTVQCAQCHNHKYDPLSQEDYYRMFSYLNDVDEFTAPIYSDEELSRRDRVLSEIKAIEREIQSRFPDWASRLKSWEASVQKDLPEWIVLEPREYGAPDGLSKLQLQKDHSLLAGGHRFIGGTWFVKAKTAMTNITAVRLEVLNDGNLPMRGPGRGDNGLFHLREFTLKAAPATSPTNLVSVKISAATADFEESQNPAGDPEKEKEKTFGGPVRFAIDGNSKTSWTVDAGPGRRNAARKAVFQLSTNLGFGEGTELRFDLACQDEVGRFRLSVTGASDPVADPLPKLAREILDIPSDRRTAEQAAAVFSQWRTTVPEFAKFNDRIEALWKQFPERSGQTFALSARPEPRVTSLLKRGDWLQPGPAVESGVPSFLHPLRPSAEPGRLRLARWFVDKKAPTTARAFVNRVWQSYFGTGIVATSEDLGVQSEAPSHPELLDWLACEFMEPTIKARRTLESPVESLPWSVKHLHRLIVLSATYRQSSRVRPELYAKDAFNRLLARGARLRVDGEIVRDIALAASGLLNTNLGGPSIYAPAPAFLFVAPSSYMSFPWKDATGPDRYRRAFYTFRRRSTPYPMLQTFDTPNGDASCVRRVRSNTPLQALTALNETLFVECAQALAKQTLVHGGHTDAERVRYAFRRVVSRWPTAAERKELLGLLTRQRRHMADGWVNVAELGTGANSPPANLPKGATPADLASYTVLSRVLLNLDEAITKE